MTECDYIDISTHEGRIPGFPLLWIYWCPHLATYPQRLPQSNFTVVWFDLANTYSSISHNLIQVTINRFQIHIKNITTSFFKDIYLHFWTISFTRWWQSMLKTSFCCGCGMYIFLHVVSHGNESSNEYSTSKRVWWSERGEWPIVPIKCTIKCQGKWYDETLFNYYHHGPGRLWSLEEKGRSSRAVELGPQGAWTRNMGPFKI